MKRLYNICKVIKLLFQIAYIETFSIIFLSIFNGIYQCLGIILWKYIIDEITNAINTKVINRILMMMIFYLIYTIVQKLLIKVDNYTVWKYTTKINIGIEKIILDKCDCIPYEEFDKSNTYNMLNKVNYESVACISSLLQKVMALIENIVAMISVIIILMPLNSVFVIIAIISIVPMLIVDIRMSNQLYELNTKLVEPKRYANKIKGLLTDYIFIREARVFTVNKYIKDKVLSLKRENFVKENKVKTKQLYVDIIINIIFTITTFAMKIWSICASVSREYSIGVVVMYLNALDSLINNLQIIVYNLAEINENMLYIDYMFEFLKKNEIINGMIKINEFKIISFKNVSFHYQGNENYVLKDISFDIKKNESYLLFGLNGEGKSTIIKLLLGLYVPTSGKILIDDVDIQDIDKNSYYNLISSIFQEFNKYPFSVIENIALNNSFSSKKIEASVIKSGAFKFISKLVKGYDTILSNELEEGVQLSLGQWQKIALSRMFYKNAQIYILDEPTASLDCESEKILFDFLFEKNQNHTIVIISHNIESAKSVDNVIVIGEAKILESGNYEKLINEKGYFYNYVNGEKKYEQN